MRASGNIFYKIGFKIALSPIFNYFIQTCIIVNTVILSLDRYPISEEEEKVHEMFNNVLAAIFVFELLIKILGMGF